jgi:2-polyprenyl-3-methyl-5-hydroxy-6-metoxy-1,4-benzoquinol methylase
LDLLETTDGARHPWERSRAAFFTGVVARSLGDVRGLDVLDVGAGDAFFGARLVDELRPRSLTCWDASYDDAMMARLRARYATLSFTRSRPARSFDLAIMLDVI